MQAAGLAMRPCLHQKVPRAAARRWGTSLLLVAGSALLLAAGAPTGEDLSGPGANGGQDARINVAAAARGGIAVALHSQVRAQPGEHPGARASTADCTHAGHV